MADTSANYIKARELAELLVRARNVVAEHWRPTVRSFSAADYACVKLLHEIDAALRECRANDLLSEEQEAA